MEETGEGQVRIVADAPHGRDPSLVLGISEKDPKDLKRSREADHAPSGAAASADEVLSRRECAAGWNEVTEVLVEAVGVEPHMLIENT